jgi:hypothetical protein
MRVPIAENDDIAEEIIQPCASLFLWLLNASSTQLKSIITNLPASTIALAQ